MGADDNGLERNPLKDSSLEEEKIPESDNIFNTISGFFFGSQGMSSAISEMVILNGLQQLVARAGKNGFENEKIRVRLGIGKKNNDSFHGEPVVISLNKGTVAIIPSIYSLMVSKSLKSITKLNDIKAFLEKKLLLVDKSGWFFNIRKLIFNLIFNGITRGISSFILTSLVGISHYFMFKENLEGCLELRIYFSCLIGVFSCSIFLGYLIITMISVLVFSWPNCGIKISKSLPIFIYDYLKSTENLGKYHKKKFFLLACCSFGVTLSILLVNLSVVVYISKKK